jgi:hypothetical protein
MKLQKVKSKVRIHLPPTLPITVSISTQEQTLFWVTVCAKVLIASADFQGNRDIRSILFFSGLEFDHPGQINGRNGEVAFVDISVDAGFGYTQVMRLKDMI